MPPEPTLHTTGSKTLRKSRQVNLPEQTDCGIRSFSSTIALQGKDILRPSGIDILQVNIGWLCNLSCSHCHVDAGPSRQEIMTRSTMNQCFEALKQHAFTTVDITGGAPEMNPDFLWFIEGIRSHRPDIEILVRTNLTLLASETAYRNYPQFLFENHVTLIASLPCYTQDTVDRQRGKEVFRRSIEGLRRLNALGYGHSQGGHELNLVYNPSGAFLPGKQLLLEHEYRSHLLNDYAVTFNHLYTLANMPISRFLQTLLDTGTYCEYMKLLADNFNPAALSALMCRNTLSVRWDGALFDCDFNQMLDLPVDSSVPRHIGEFDREKLLQRQIITGQHCYGCTAGSGSSCRGCLV